MEYHGYAGKVLYVDLSTGSIRKEPLDLEIAQKFIGGMGVQYRLLYDILKPGVDPLSPDNPVIVGTGPLGGTLAPGSNKLIAAYKAPLISSQVADKHLVRTATAGSKRFVHMMKSAGYDQIVITGRAKKPSYLKIVDDDVEICDASDLWGKGVTETHYELVRRHGGAKAGCGVWNIGPAGQNLVKWAHAFVDGRGSMGQHGGGAILGSKNLLAVVVLGTKGIRVADRQAFMAAVDRKRKEIMAHPYFGHFFPDDDGGWGGYKEYPAEAYHKTMVCRSACMSCMGPEFSFHQIREGRFAGDTEVAFMIQVRDYGRRLGLTDYRDSMRLCFLAHRAGLDSMVAIRMIYFVTRLYERGVISTKETGGLVLRKGDFDCYAKLLEKIVNREDIGDIMAEGWYPLSEKVGVDASKDFRDGDFIVKGGSGQLDARFIRLDPRLFAQVVNPRLHHVHQATHYPMATEELPEEVRKFKSLQTLDSVKQDFERMSTTREEFERVFTAEDFNTGRLEKHAEDCHAVYNSLSICDISPYGLQDPMRDLPLLAELYSAATGFVVSPRELKIRGERIWNLNKLFNVREGFTREDDQFPAVWVQNIKTPIHHRTGDLYLRDWFGRRLNRNDLHKMLDDYYDERGWDIEKGIPTREKIYELGLEEFDEFIQIVDSLLE